MNIYRAVIREKLDGLPERQREREAVRLKKLERLHKWKLEAAQGQLPKYAWRYQEPEASA